ncbi:MAG: hypothetical protein U0517_04560 [Candidatus Andersenbacteria bacterium]
MRFLHSLWPARIGLTIILIVELLGASGVLGITPDFTWKGMLLQCVVIWASIEAVRFVIDRHKLNMSIGPAALIVMLQVVVDAVGDMGHLYSRFDWYDQILHFSGGFAAALVTTALFKAIHERQKNRIFPRAEIFFDGFSLSVLAQLLYEFEEYMEDVLTGSNRLGDGFDTVNDLTLGAAGALLAALIVLKFPRLTNKR